jgi:UDP-N-acetylglucosamine transferase subunit ALG13
VIFVTVGTHHQPFSRLIEALAALPAEELVVQHGRAPAPPGVAYAAPHMPFSDVVESMERADAVVTHAGVGSIFCARRAGHVPVVVPRQRRYREHVDDHQVELTRALAERGAVVPVWRVEDLADAVGSAPPRATVAAAGDGALQSAVRRALLSGLACA